ncbi:hypothetical protein F5Y04DRAFT_285633 [Hypomontagnella monticulosa]|nr:hypothetical protein F5Y04DRAFT_285633 [Hypomontagnella monticulosa]
MKIRYKAIAIPLFRAWKDAKQINDAEIFVTILVGSLLSMDGCNAKQPGTRSLNGRVDAIAYQKSRDHVFGKPWITENMRQTMLDRETDEERRIRETMEQMKNDIRI